MLIVMNTLMILLSIILIDIGYSLAKCNVEFIYKEEDSNETVLDHYLKTRASHKQFFKNLYRGRLVDPICTSKKSLVHALCECINDKKAGSAVGKAPKGDITEKAVCQWNKLFTSKKVSSTKDVNLFLCKIESNEFYIMQGYEAHPKKIYDVYVVKKETNNKSFIFIIEGMAQLVDFSSLEDDTPLLLKLYNHGLSWFFGWN